MINPASAVFVGGRVLEPAIANCRAKGFAGPIHVINPQRREIAGIACLPALEALPEVPDVAYLAVPKEAVVEIVAGLAGLGVGGVVCHSSGFSELAGQGRGRQSDLVAAAGSMALLGPNTPGFANFLDNAAFMQDHFGDHEAVTEGVAVVSNGGAYLSDAGCAERGLPLAYLFGLGNQAVLTLADLFDYVLDDPRVTAVNLYFEGFRDVAKLSAAALKAARKGIPVVAVKGGRSRSGGRATQTHTASLAGDAAVASALFERLGFVEAESTAAALEMLKMLVFTGRPQGARAALVTSSGSYAVLGADAAEAAGLAVPAPTPARAAAVGALLPDFIGPANPLDISTAQDFPPERQKPLFDSFFASDCDVVVQVMCFPPPGGMDIRSWYATSKSVAEAAAVRGLPAAFVATLAEGLPARARAQMIADRMAPLMGLEHGMQAVAAAVRQGALAKRLAGLEAADILLPPAQAPVAEVDYLDEAAAKARLAAAGVAVPRGRRWDGLGPFDPHGLAAPRALKALVPGLLHKSDAGALALDLASPEALAEAAAEMREGLQGREIAGFLVEEMIEGGLAELLVGIRRAPEVGLVLTLGFGGLAVELLPDTASLLLPAPRSEIARTLGALAHYPLLTGWRGRPAADLEALLDCIEALCRFALDQGAGFVELEINPLIVRPDGAVAVDAVLALANPFSKGAPA